MPFTSPTTRTEPPTVAEERAALAARLDWQRDTLLWKLEGLDDEQLRRPMVPSGVSLLGIVQHLMGVEHGWFVTGVAGLDEPDPFVRADGSEADFDIHPDDTTEAIVAGYLRACARSRQIVEAASLDQTFDDDPEAEDPGTTDVRWVMLHMIEETARHNGHADVLRELIDGATGE